MILSIDILNNVKILRETRNESTLKLLSFYLYRSLDVKQRENDSNSANSVFVNASKVKHHSRRRTSRVTSRATSCVVRCAQCCKENIR